jgi:Aspartyl/asparaginyl-tRNA synthetases
MIEPEVAFADLEANMDLAEDFCAILSDSPSRTVPKTWLFLINAWPRKKNKNPKKTGPTRACWKNSPS